LNLASKMTNKKGNLIVILGPTAVGKTSVAITIAKKYGAEIISADSRQFYKEIKLGTAAPTVEEMQAVKHHFVGTLSVTDHFNVSEFEQEVLKLLEIEFAYRKTMVMVGGSGLYIDAVCNGIDELPNADTELRTNLNKLFEDEGLEAIQQKLHQLDPKYYAEVDLKNPKRLIRALEVCLQTGKPYSQLRTGQNAERPFNIIKIGLEMDRMQLNERILRRLHKMIQEGWLAEVKSVEKSRGQNALNTVGYKELFRFLDGEWTLEEAVEKINVNTRRYAKRQMTWFKRDKEIKWFAPDDTESIFNFIDSCIISD